MGLLLATSSNGLNESKELRRKTIISSTCGAKRQRLEAVKALRTLACERVNCTHSIDRRSSRPMLYPRAVAWCLSRSMLYAVMDLVARQTEVRITFVVDGVGNGE